MKPWITLILSIHFIKAADISVFLDLSRQSECNEVENQLANEASESARQRDELLQWASQRMDSILDLQTSKIFLLWTLYLLCTRLMSLLLSLLFF